MELGSWLKPIKLAWSFLTRYARLEARVTTLEQKLSRVPTEALDPMTCRACRTGTVHIEVIHWETASFGVAQTTTRVCDRCGHRDEDTQAAHSVSLADVRRNAGESP